MDSEIELLLSGVLKFDDDPKKLEINFTGEGARNFDSFDSVSVGGCTFIDRNNLRLELTIAGVKGA